KILPSKLGGLATLWAMLPNHQIQRHPHHQPYKRFLFIELPSPMLLWMTGIHTKDKCFQLLPCYLDLQDPKSREILVRMTQTGYYRLLLFSTETPQKCTQVMTTTLDPQQCQMLHEWLEASQISETKAQSGVSKFLLKNEFEKIKSQPLEKFDSDNLNYPLAI
ncbi:MAG: serine/threonine protein kinase, partial [Symploca sp. SIO1C4]|nr:serine/threonine protein kinase [Symploca sp. SIO1C4]